jgi:hypothetical protein
MYPLKLWLKVTYDSPKSVSRPFIIFTHLCVILSGLTDLAWCVARQLERYTDPIKKQPMRGSDHHNSIEEGIFYRRVYVSS